MCGFITLGSVLIAVAGFVLFAQLPRIYLEIRKKHTPDPDHIGKFDRLVTRWIIPLVVSTLMLFAFYLLILLTSWE